MEGLYGIFGKLAFILLAVWVVLAGLGMTTMPAAKKQHTRRNLHPGVKGTIWAVPVTQAPSCEEGLAWPMVM